MYATIDTLPMVENERMWAVTRLILGVALALLLMNTTFGCLNVLRADAIPHWQRLVHLHAGCVGWLTLALIGVTFWLFTGDRPVTRMYDAALQPLQ